MPTLTKAFLLSVLLAVGCANADSDAPQRVTFDAQVLPILERHCIDCHSGWFPDAGVDLSSREEILAGGPSGPLIVPGKPDKGWLMHTINKSSGRQRMPPQGPPLSSAEKDTLKRWILDGAR